MVAKSFSGMSQNSSGEMSYFKDGICLMSSMERDETCSSTRSMSGSGIVKDGAD